MNDMQLPAGVLSSSSVHLNAEQEIAVRNILQFVESYSLGSWYFCFTGYAGTGKTFCMREVASRLRSSHVSIAYTAPTNKAAKVLRSITGEATTIFALLGLRIDKSGELKALVSGRTPDLSDIDVVVVDEASMVNSNLFDILRVAAERWGFKVIFMGDLAQLPPVGEVVSPALSGNVGASLSRVMRHDNQILTFATAVRKQVNSIAPCINIKSDHEDWQGVWKLTAMDFKKRIYEAAANGEFADGQQSKIIAWRNVRVGEYNNIARAAIFGSGAMAGYYLPGDRIVAAAPCLRGDEPMLHTDDEAIVESVVDCVHPFDTRYRALEITARSEMNRVVRLIVVHPESRQAWENDGQMLASNARTNSKLWKRFWEHKELFMDIRYAYAITAHRAQGSTYETAFVDYQDLLYNRNRTEAFKALYVAVTRPTKRLYLA